MRNIQILEIYVNITSKTGKIWEDHIWAKHIGDHFCISAGVNHLHISGTAYKKVSESWLDVRPMLYGKRTLPLKFNRILVSSMAHKNVFHVKFRGYKAWNIGWLRIEDNRGTYRKIQWFVIVMFLSNKMLCTGNKSSHFWSNTNDNPLAQRMDLSKNTTKNDCLPSGKRLHSYWNLPLK